MQIIRQFASDPWFVAMMIVLVISTIVTLWAIRGYVRDWLLLAMALPPALFKKTFGEPPDH